MHYKNEAQRQAMQSAVNLIDEGHEGLARQLLIDALEAPIDDDGENDS